MILSTGEDQMREDIIIPEEPKPTHDESFYDISQSTQTEERYQSKENTWPNIPRNSMNQIAGYQSKDLSAYIKSVKSRLVNKHGLEENDSLLKNWYTKNQMIDLMLEDQEPRIKKYFCEELTKLLVDVFYRVENSQDILQKLEKDKAICDYKIKYWNEYLTEKDENGNLKHNSSDEIPGINSTIAAEIKRSGRILFVLNAIRLLQTEKRTKYVYRSYDFWIDFVKRGC